MTCRDRSTAPGTWRMAAGGLALGLALGLAWQWPAAWVPGLSGAPEGTAGLQLAAISGSVWQGSAVLATSDGLHAALALPGRLRWSVHPAWHGGPALQVAFTHDTAMPAAATLTVSLAGIQVARLAASCPAAWLSGLGVPWNTLGLGGRLLLQADAARLLRSGRTWALDGRITVQAQSVTSRLSPVAPLGSYRLAITGARAAPEFTLDTIEGVLRLSGKGGWYDGGLHFRGEGRAAPGHAQDLAELLGLVGRYRGGVSELRVN